MRGYPMKGVDRFWANTRKNGPWPKAGSIAAERGLGQCWRWTGPLNRGGYGHTSFDGVTQAAYVFAYKMLVGPIPVGHELDHLCRFRPCVNPAHLEPSTHAQNIKRSPITTGALNAQRTECRRGHPFTPENTYLTPKEGWRVCNACRKLRQAKKQEIRA